MNCRRNTRTTRYVGLIGVGISLLLSGAGLVQAQDHSKAELQVLRMRLFEAEQRLAKLREDLELQTTKGAVAATSSAAVAPPPSTAGTQVAVSTARAPAASAQVPDLATQSAMVAPQVTEPGGSGAGAQGLISPSAAIQSIRELAVPSSAASDADALEIAEMEALARSTLAADEKPALGASPLASTQMAALVPMGAPSLAAPAPFTPFANVRAFFTQIVSDTGSSVDGLLQSVNDNVTPSRLFALRSPGQGALMCTLSVLMLGSLLWMIQRRRLAAHLANQAFSTLPDRVAEPPDMIRGPDSTQAFSVTDAYSILGPQTTSSVVEVSALETADMFMAYGRTGQAEEVLSEELQRDANNPDVIVRLLQIYATAGQADSFSKLAQKLYRSTGGSGPHWESAAQMGRDLDPSNRMYGASARAAGNKADNGAKFTLAIV